jgi:hypothetical protein
MSSQLYPNTWFSSRSLLLTLAIIITVVVASACASAAPQTEQIVVAPIDDDYSDQAMTREELEDQVRRFSDRYYTRIALAVGTIRKSAKNDNEVELLQGWQSISQATVVDIAVGPNPVTNLMDMMVLTSLQRMVIKDYWSPEVFGETRGAVLLEAATMVEEDIWAIADNVLTADQQGDLMNLVTEWHKENPDQIYPWMVRMGEFSGQRAAALEAVKQSGGMLKAVHQARETAEELQAFGERVLFYLQRAPAMTSNAMETSVLQLLGGRHVAEVMEDADRFVNAVEHLIDVIEALPGGRLAAVDQFVEGVRAERRLLFEELSSAQPEMQAMLVELRQTLEIVDQITARFDSGEESSEPVDIAGYQALTEEVANAMTELRLTLGALGGVLDSSPALIALVDQLVERESEMVNQLLLYAMILILFFFVVLFAYRFAAAKTLPQ